MTIPIWLIYGLLASLCWGSCAIVSKIVTSKNHLGIISTEASLLMLGGITIVFLLYFTLQQKIPSMELKLGGLLLMIVVLGYVIYAIKQMGVQISFPVLGFGFLQGILWAGGMVLAFLAFSSGADAAKLVPIYNTNTLIAVMIGLFALHEVPAPDERLKVVTGALLIVIGGILINK